MSKETTKPRRRMFHRLEEGLPPLAITKRDLRILELIGDYRFLNTEQIHALIGGSKHNVTERLSRLFHHAYLDRPSHQRELRSEGYRQMIYALAPEGARLLAHEVGETASAPCRLSASNRSAKRFYMAHTLMVSQFRACLELGCKAEPDLELQEWRVPDRPLARVSIGRSRVAVIPDAQFVLKAADGHVAYFFLEADRGTMSHRRFLAKLQAYWHMRSLSRDHEIPRAFRVLVVAPSQQRMENLLDTATDADPRHSGSRMFCFTVESEYSLKTPEALFDRIWRTPVDLLPRSILDGRGGANV